jgi:pSer/pThr/pTyr-binding forkhead associated (FHA) protein
MPAKDVFRLDTENQSISLCEGENVIGRDPEANVFIDSVKVSRRHARIMVAGDTATLEDLDSKNGTYLHGRRLTAPVRLANTDVILIGHDIARLRFIVEDEPTLPLGASVPDDKHT